MSARKEWMLGIPGHNELVNLDQVLLLVRGGSLRPTDLVKKLGEPWRAANEVTELAPHFTDAPPQAQRATVEPIPLKPGEAKQGEPIRTTTDRVARMGGKTPETSRRGDPRSESNAVKPAPKPEEKAPETPKPSEDRAPIRTQTARVATVSAPPKTEAKPAPPPPKEEKKEEKKSDPAKSETKAEGSATDKLSSRRKPQLTKPPPQVEPSIEPMVAKYYSPVDMLRCASFAFEPKKLLYSSPVVILMIIWSIGMYRSQSGTGGGVFEGVLFILFMTILIFGFAFILTSLAFVSRRQLEGRDYYVGEVVHYTAKSAVTALVYPIAALVPSLLSLGILFLLGLARNRSTGMASTLKVGFILPMIFAFITVLGALVYQVACMYVPAAAAIEGEGLGGSIRHAWDQVRRQWGRVVLHWLIVTVAFGVISAVCMGLSILAILLPEWIWKTDDAAILAAWNQFTGIQAVYHGLAYGLGMMLPVSLLSTLGTLSYLSLRTPAGAQLSPSPMEDTSGITLGAMRGHGGPGDSTNPSETRPAPAEPSAPLSDISDDSDEQPLVKD
ncbi:MAG: hypothetical protein HY293_09360 [Planctomycetes bacterium]|nr:hypothetical protein [Planctomycetota bacterium]